MHELFQAVIDKHKDKHKKVLEYLKCKLVSLKSAIQRNR